MVAQESAGGQSMIMWSYFFLSLSSLFFNLASRWSLAVVSSTSVLESRMCEGIIPPPATGTLFADMTDTTYWATKWAEQAYLDGLLPACSDGPLMFCPFVMLDRAWGAYLIVQAKDLLLP